MDKNYGYVLHGLLIILIWVGMWGICDTIIDKFIGDKFWAQIATYIAITLVAGGLLVYLDGIKIFGQF